MIRLNKTNYLLCRAQLLPYFRSTKLLGYLDGTVVAPPKMVATSIIACAESIINPAYEHWYDQDQQVLNGLLSSMIEENL